MKLIPTTEKEKLPRGFSYPIGAEHLSSALDGVPQYDKFVLVFRWRDEYWASKYMAKLKSGGEVVVLDVNCHAPSYDWRVYVSAIPAEHKSRARLQLNDALFEQLRKDLRALPEVAHFSWRAKYHLGRGVLCCG